ncbi:hypothetical protein [Streptomyces sp. NPDC003710]
MNAVDSPMAGVSARQNLTKEDQIDERTFNEAIWKSVRGVKSVVPVPKHGLYGSAPDDGQQGPVTGWVPGWVPPAGQGAAPLEKMGPHLSRPVVTVAVCLI